jgi:protein ImuB
LHPEPRTANLNSSLFACVWLAGEPGRRGLSNPDVLSHLARDFSPRVETHGAEAVVLDVSGLGRLLGEPRAIGDELRRTAADRGLRVRVAVAGTRIAALLAAHERAGVTVIAAGTEAESVAPLPLRTLEIFQPAARPAGGHPPIATGRARRRQGLRTGSARNYRLAPPPTTAAGELRLPLKPDTAFADRLQTLRRWGLRTLGDLAALPPAELVERLGEEGARLRQLARGEDPRPLVPEVFEAPFEASLDLEWPVEGLEPLSFVLGRLLDPLTARLVRGHSGAVEIEVRLRLVTCEEHVRTLQLPSPFSDPKTLRTLILLDLEAHPPPAGIERVTIAVDPAPGRVVQFSLLERALPSPEQLSTLMARLGALVGEQRAGTAALADSYQPDGFSMRPLVLVSGPPTTPSHPAIRPALRRFRPPIPARVTVEHDRPAAVRPRRPGLAGGPVETWAGPWRTSGQWWLTPASTPQTAAHAWNRDEWDVGLREGTIYRLYRVRPTGEWFVDGVID